MNESVTSYKLKRPIKVGEEMLDTLNFAEPTLEMLEAMERGAKASGMAGLLKLISMSANQPVAVVSRISAMDLPGIMETLRPFLPAETPGLSANVGGGE